MPKVTAQLSGSAGPRAHASDPRPRASLRAAVLSKVCEDSMEKADCLFVISQTL